MKLTLNNLSKFFQFGLLRKRPDLPIFFIFNLTSLCDMACRHCSDDVWGDPQNDISLKAIKEFSLKLGKIERIALTGGEPFLREDLVEICQLFSDNNGVSTILINSNGYKTDNICASVRSILTECPRTTLQITLSLDGFQETHDNIRKAGSFSKVLETARQLKELSTQFPRFSLGSFNCTINNENWKELPSLTHYIRNEFQTDLTFNLLFGKPRDGSMKLPTKNELKGIFERLMKNTTETFLSRLLNKVYLEMLLLTYSQSYQVVHCQAGSLVGQIYSNGDVHACPSLPSLGNIQVKSFKDIWHGNEALKQLFSIKNGECLCNNVCYLRLSLFSSWKLPFLMMKSFFITTKE